MSNFQCHPPDRRIYMLDLSLFNTVLCNRYVTTSKKHNGHNGTLRHWTVLAHCSLTATLKAFSGPLKSWHWKLHFPWPTGVNKLMFRIEQGLLRLLCTKPHRKHQSVVRNSWYCTHLFNQSLCFQFGSEYNFLVLFRCSLCFDLSVFVKYNSLNRFCNECAVFLVVLLTMNKLNI